MRTLKHLLLAASAVVIVAGCSSNPTADQPGAPIETRGGTGSTGPGTGTAPGGGTSNPNAIDLTQKPAAGGVDPRVKQGILAQRSVYFAFDSDSINEKFRPMLQAHAAYLSGNKPAKMLIQGNTDERGSREYNLALGQRRAEAVKKTLVLMGAGEGQIEAVSLGEEKPRRTGRSEEDYTENRRGDILYGGEF